MYTQHKDRVEFLVIYIREAHPTDHDEWQQAYNLRDEILFAQPQTKEERFEVATACQIGMKISIPMLVDGIDNACNQEYTAQPDRLYIIGADGRIVYKGRPGPHGFKPEEAEEVIKVI